MKGRGALLVVDLGFGDSGKGTVTDWAVREYGAELVVRYNGGAQAGHTVVCPEGPSHTFAQFGAGSFVPGVRTHLGPEVRIHPLGMLVEAQALAAAGLNDALSRIEISPEALLITPYHQAAGRIRELLRGDARHGSCGIGVGEAVRQDLDRPGHSLRAGEIAGLVRKGGLGALERRFEQQRESLLSELEPERMAVDPGSDPGETFARELDLLRDSELSADLARAFLAWSRAVTVRSLALPERGVAIFEGAQGVLLDERVGFHPHTTWSDCTLGGADRLLDGWDCEQYRLGVLRVYATRHGPGPFPTEDPDLNFPEPHNRWGPWQGGWRQGWPDAVLGRYAARAVDRSGAALHGLALTHCDRLSQGPEPQWQLAVSYAGGEEIEPSRSGCLIEQHRLTRRLSWERPIYDRVDSPELPARMAHELGLPLALVSTGPTYLDKRPLDSAIKTWGLSAGAGPR